jgi:hypothetical protein
MEIVQLHAYARQTRHLRTLPSGEMQLITFRIKHRSGKLLAKVILFPLSSHKRTFFPTISVRRIRISPPHTMKINFASAPAHIHHPNGNTGNPERFPA